MPQFIYRAKQGLKELTEGVIEADNVDSAVAKILHLGYTPYDVKPLKKSFRKVAKQKKTFSFNFNKRIPSNVIVSFTRQIADLVDADVPMLRILTVIQGQTKHHHFKGILDQIYAFVKDGGMLSAALAQHPDVFSNLYINMVKTGEVSGNLNNVLDRLSDYLERDEEIRAKVKQSMLYPKFILCVGAVALFVLMIWIMPMILSLFENFDQQLPLPTIILLGMSEMMARFWWIFFGLGCCLIFFIYKVQSSVVGRLWLDNVRLKIPYWGDFLRDVEISRFSRTLATLLENGIVITTALETVYLIIENQVIKEAVQNISLEVQNGSSLTHALNKSPFFPEVVSHMIAVGEETGQLHKGLSKVAVNYERHIQRVINSILDLLGPILILIVSLIVGFIVFALLWPLLTLNLAIS